MPWSLHSDFGAYRQSPYNPPMHNSYALSVQQLRAAEELLRGDVVMIGSTATTKTDITG